MLQLFSAQPEIYNKKLLFQQVIFKYSLLTPNTADKADKLFINLLHSLHFIGHK